MPPLHTYTTLLPPANKYCKTWDQILHPHKLCAAQYQYPPKTSPHKHLSPEEQRSRNKELLIGFIVIVGIALIVAGFLALKRRVAGKKPLGEEGQQSGGNGDEAAAAPAPEHGVDTNRPQRRGWMGRVFRRRSEHPGEGERAGLRPGDVELESGRGSEGGKDGAVPHSPFNTHHEGSHPRASQTYHTNSNHHETPKSGPTREGRIGIPPPAYQQKIQDLYLSGHEENAYGGVSFRDEV